MVSAEGQVEVARGMGLPWRRVGLEDTLCPGDRVRVGRHSRAAVFLIAAETLLRLDQGTTLTLLTPEAAGSSLLDLARGALHILSRVLQRLEVRTPFVSAGVEGTEFALRVGGDQTDLWVYEGRVRFANSLGSLPVSGGESAFARRGRAPQRRIAVHPRAAVQWALYYPPLIDARPERYPAALRPAVWAYRRNDLQSAITALDAVPDPQRGDAYYGLRAGLLLSVGRVAETERDIAAALKRNPRNGTALALRAVIAVVRNQSDEALGLARQAIEAEPQSPAPYTARSYAEQSAFRIEEALESAKGAARVAPRDALVWARIAELESSLGDLDASLEAAKKAEQLDPRLARTQTVLGFAELTRIEVDAAKRRFTQALRLDPADPLPRLGLGLAKIRAGDVDEGTKEIEIAAALDPGNSLVRSYLGKAYYEQKRAGLASTEFEQAKLLDPKDPTPWFYDAIHKQTTNRPVEALHDLQRAIDLNDNRAVYRSRLLLDQDLAARSAALGRIYRDLGFEQRALVEGWKSVNTDPSDYSAHRLLADSYSALPRHEVARVSELLQSQLLQPLNLTPVQPNLAESNLLILEGGGPSDSAYNEFNPLFTANRLALQTSGLVGSHETVSEEVTQSGLWRSVSYSIGQLHYESQGFRDNNDLRHDIYNAFVQTSLSPSLNVQAEFRHTDTRHGNLALEFVPSRQGRCRSDFFCNFSFKRDALRFGLHYAPMVGSDVIATAGYQDAEEEQNFDLPPPSVEARRGYSGEAQYLFSTERVKAVLGGGYYDLGSTVAENIVARQGPIFPTRTRHGNGYLYSYLAIPRNVTWTLGASIDALDEAGQGDFDKINPKFGVAWDLTPNTTLRAAVFKVLKRSLIADQTVEPTQIAGFNQFFDDANGTWSTRYGLAFDHRFSSSLFGGIEFSKRHLTVPRFGNGRSFIDWEEELYRAYAYWTPRPYVSLSIEYELEDFERLERLDTGRPPNTETHMAPTNLSFFHPSGFFARLSATYVHQEVELPESVVLDDQDEFVIADAMVGYRLPNRHGIVTLELRNVFDTQFNFQGPDFRIATQKLGVPPPFQPEQSLLMNVTLAF